MQSNLKSMLRWAILALVLATTVSLIWSGCETRRDLATAPTDQSVTQAVGSLGKQDDRISNLAAIQARNEDRVLGLAGVTGMGIGTDGSDLVFHVFINSRAAAATPQNIEGVRVVRIPTDEFVAWRDNGPNHRTQLSPPIPGGVSTSNDNGCFAGTRGFLAYKSGQVGYITNSHVAAAGGRFLCPGKASIGEPQYHLGTFDNNCSTSGTVAIGALESFVKFQKGRVGNRVDAAFVASSTSLISAEQLDIGVPTTTAVDPVLSMTVKKSGRTTGLTTGSVTTINATVQVNYGSGCGIFKFTGQFVVTPGGFSAAGDSGSGVVDGSNNPVGLLFAGSSSATICNPINAVLSELGLNF